MYTDSCAGAIQCLEDNAIEEVVALAAQRVEDGTCEWTPDPEVEGVWGLVLAGTTHAQVVVYCSDGDFQVSDDFYEDAR